MRRVRILRYAVATFALLFGAMMLALWIDPGDAVRAIHVRCSRLTVGAISDNRRLVLVAQWAPPSQADEIWHWACQDAYFERFCRWQLDPTRRFEIPLGWDSRSRDVRATWVAADLRMDLLVPALDRCGARPDVYRSVRLAQRAPPPSPKGRLAHSNPNDEQMWMSPFQMPRRYALDRCAMLKWLTTAGARSFGALCHPHPSAPARGDGRVESCCRCTAGLGLVVVRSLVRRDAAALLIRGCAADVPGYGHHGLETRATGRAGAERATGRPRAGEREEHYRLVKWIGAAERSVVQ